MLISSQHKLMDSKRHQLTVIDSQYLQLRRRNIPEPLNLLLFIVRQLQ
jgi:hypothetical protein